MTISPDWPYIAIIALLIACGYAGMVRRLNDHPRYGPFWGGQAWVEVVAGNCLIALTAGLIAGLEVALLVLGINVLWGLPMIVATLVSQARQRAREIEERIAADGRQSFGP